MREDKCLFFSKKYGYMVFINLCAGREIEKRAPTILTLPYTVTYTQSLWDQRRLWSQKVGQTKPNLDRNLINKTTYLT